MSLDIVEIALEHFTDHSDFEKIATEIMRDVGYSNIKPLGGVADKGRDAICESYFLSEGLNNSVFQYTLEEYLPGKIKDTIVKLNNAGIEFNELVMMGQISRRRAEEIENAIIELDFAVKNRQDRYMKKWMEEARRLLGTGGSSFPAPEPAKPERGGTPKLSLGAPPLTHSRRYPR